MDNPPLIRKRVEQESNGTWSAYIDRKLPDGTWKMYDFQKKLVSEYAAWVNADSMASRIVEVGKGRLLVEEAAKEDLDLAVRFEETSCGKEWVKTTENWHSYPNHNMPVWVFIPTLGNEDEGWGMVQIAWWDRHLFGGGVWRNHLGSEEPGVTYWAFMHYPEPIFRTDERPEVV